MITIKYSTGKMMIDFFSFYLFTKVYFYFFIKSKNLYQRNIKILEYKHGESPGLIGQEAAGRLARRIGGD